MKRKALDFKNRNENNKKMKSRTTQTSNYAEQEVLYKDKRIKFRFAAQ